MSRTGFKNAALLVFPPGVLIFRALVCVSRGGRVFAVPSLTLLLAPTDQWDWPGKGPRGDLRRPYDKSMSDFKILQKLDLCYEPSTAPGED